ncbi:MAG TPA: rhomboid family intramembrane serine protease [Candidatus Acidoferrales bacterium]|nr:rhomboid family intramembrane serine protease [Candidatus Acidoferrales bacterium]
MIPLKDTTPRRSFPIVTVLLIVANVVVFIHQIMLPPHAQDLFIKTYAFTPRNLQLALQGHRYTLQQGLIPLFTSVFLHGGFMHILGNMWFLWIFGGNVEDRMGSVTYLFFYLVCGLGSGITQTAFSWGSNIPSLGASGAISGVLGAYIVFFPGSRILTLIPLFIIFFTARIPAWIFIGLWFLAQFLSGLGSLNAPGAANAGGVAWWAHVGGFALGLLIARSMGSRRTVASYG